jgi:hypothetical protein
MTQSLNLIPEQEIQEQTKTKVLKLSTIFAMLLLVVICGISAYLFVSTSKIKTQIKAEDDAVSALRSQINGMSSIEVNARNLSKKYSALKDLLTSRIFYSTLLEDFMQRRPSEISIDSFSVAKDNTLSISGISPTYILIKVFSNNLLDINYKDQNPKLQGLFTSVVLNQVDLTQKGSVMFSMTLTFDPKKIQYAE